MKIKIANPTTLNSRKSFLKKAALGGTPQFHPDFPGYFEPTPEWDIKRSNDRLWR